ncbi:hypothetical protein KNP414_07005 [Paenibacillus mucilaginosus KNP414]|uniref:Uncharacterized protein n=1 Tax=Paenibacillus mucilaginosus (strain KNP414) TaxID=1036673 RepID=F8FIR3_PAEMK|nr:hypothetical protein KNP414_07005 [Paenibacillus mucilaginosus KNP414]
MNNLPYRQLDCGAPRPAALSRLRYVFTPACPASNKSEEREKA